MGGCSEEWKDEGYSWKSHQSLRPCDPADTEDRGGCIRGGCVDMAFLGGCGTYTEGDMDLGT